MSDAQADDKVRGASMLWQIAFDAIRDAVAVTDAEGRVLQVNEAMARLTRRGNDALAGAQFEAVLENALEVDRLSLLAAVLLHKDRESIELPSKGRWLRVTGDPVVDPDGAVRRVIIVIADITELKQLEEVQRQRAEELSAADRRKDEFLAMLAHELRNPLNAITASNNLQERVGAQDQQNIRLRGVVTRQTRNLARLVGDLLEVSRITRDSIQLHKEPGDLRQVLREAIQSTLPQVEAKHQQVTIQLPADPVYVNGDMPRLEQVIENIIGNASKYSATGGHILVKCEVVPEGVEIRVRDNGVGIPREKLSSIFELFVQIDQSEARVGGLGIGLTIARRLAALHGGTIEVSSDGVGQGSEFVVRLPVAGAEAQSILGLNTSDAPPVTGDRLGVLLIEDNEDTRELMRNLLESWGHQVSVAADGETGLATALNTHPDVALINVALPGIDGYQVARNLRASTAGKEMLLIALTGRPEDRARTLECGFDLHLVKPVQPEKLYGILADPPVTAKRQRA